MPRLWRPAAVCCVGWDRVALKHGHPLEVVGQRTSGSYAAHSSTYHNGLLAKY
jgi:hypothetical protein